MSRIESIATFEFASVSRYDLLLVVLPVPMFLGLGSGLATGLPTEIGVSAGGAVSALLLGYALFIDAPRPKRNVGRRGRSI